VSSLAQDKGRLDHDKTRESTDDPTHEKEKAAKQKQIENARWVAQQQHRARLIEERQLALSERLGGGPYPEYVLSSDRRVYAWTEYVGRYGLTRAGFQTWLDPLSQMPIATANLRLVSLVDNGPTEGEIEKRFRDGSFLLASRESSSQLFAQARETPAKIVIVLGHIVAGYFRWQDRSRAWNDARVSSLEKVFREAGSLPLFVGCNSALFTRYGTGARGKINSYDVVGRLAEAFASQNLATFLGSLSAPEAKMQLAPPDAVELSDLLRFDVVKSSGRASIYVSKLLFPPTWCSGELLRKHDSACVPKYEFNFCAAPQEGINCVSPE